MPQDKMGKRWSQLLCNRLALASQCESHVYEHVSLNLEMRRKCIELGRLLTDAAMLAGILDDYITKYGSTKGES